MFRLRIVMALGLVLTACTAATGEPASTTTTTATTTTSTTTTSTTTAGDPPTTVPPDPAEPAEVETSPGITTTVYRPAGTGPWPAVVLVPGGGWRSADPAGLRPMAEELAASGTAVYLTTYHLDAGAAFAEIACVVAVARDDAGGTVLLAGHSAGAQLTATVALGGDRFAPVDGCAAPAASYRPPEAWVGMSGPYEIQAIVALGGIPALERFVGGTLGEAPGAWDLADPYSHVAGAPRVDLTLVHGRADIVVFPLLTQRFSEVLLAAGGDPVTGDLEGADHNDVYDTDDAGAETIRLILEAVARIG
jgi:acetyl esterase/lipase